MDKTSENVYSVILPANQTTDAQLARATKGTWNPRKPTAEQQALMDQLTRRGGRVVSPYAPAPTQAKPKKDNNPLGYTAEELWPKRPAFIPTKSGQQPPALTGRGPLADRMRARSAQKETQAAPKSADRTGGMFGTTPGTGGAY